MKDTANYRSENMCEFANKVEFKYVSTLFVFCITVNDKTYNYISWFRFRTIRVLQKVLLWPFTGTNRKNIPKFPYLRTVTLRIQWEQSHFSRKVMKGGITLQWIFKLLSCPKFNKIITK